MILIVDAHIHLHQYENIKKSIEQWQIAGVTRIVAVSNDLRSSYETLSLKEKYPEFIFAAIGFHPEQPLPCNQDVTEWHSLLRKSRHLVSAIGEIGLPYYTLNTIQSQRLDDYIEFLSELVVIGKEQDLPVVLHAVHSHALLVHDLLVKHRVNKAHFHWLKADKAVVTKIVKQGYYVSVTPEVCYRQRDQQLARQVPLTHLMAETDGPWPFSGPFQNQLTSPLFLKEIVKTVAYLKETTYEAACRQLTLNTLKLYGQ